MPDSLIAQYKNKAKRRRTSLLLLLLAFILLVHISLVVGSSEVGLKQLYQFVFGKADPFTYQVLLDIRLPRIVGAFLSGTALAVSGAVVQSLLRNPLASPFTLGISGSSAFGAAFAIVVLGAGSSYAGSNDLPTINNPYLVASSAFIFSLLSVGIVFLLSRFKGASSEVIILSGIIISSLFGAGISAMQYFADDVQLASIVFWSFGDLGRAEWKDAFIITAVLIPILAYFMRQSWSYKALHSSDEHAMSLGVKVAPVRLGGMVAASIATAIVVSFYGVIAFVGLVVPHIVRRLTGSDEQFLIPVSAFFGGLFLLLSDTLARTIISPVILPVGILTSFIGAPLFLFLLIKGIGKGYWN